MPFGRRQFLELGLLGGASLALPGRAGALGPSLLRLRPFTRPLSIPPVLVPTPDAGTDRYVIDMTTGQQGIAGHRMSAIWGYNGRYPGPTIKARSGRRVVIRQTNLLPEPMSVHLHGGHTAPEHDGHPTDVIPPGSFRDYDHGNAQVSATLWYHDHAADATGRHVYMGLAGFYIVGDDFEDALNLPTGSHDVPLIIQDRRFNHDGSLDYPDTDQALVVGALGDRMLVNGRIQPFFEVSRRKWRFRLLNGSNSRIFDLALSNGQPFVQIGSDGGLLPAPANRALIRLGAGERADVVVNFAAVPLGSRVYLRNVYRASPRDRVPSRLMRFDVTRNEADGSVVPSTLRPFAPLPQAGAMERTFTLGQTVFNGRPAWTIGGQLFDPGRVDFVPRLGDVEIWTFTNSTPEPHPIHLHGFRVQILELDGSPPPPGVGNCWKDTVLVPAAGSARLITRFADHTGVYVFHCHVLEHADHAMMAQFEVVP